MDQPHYMHMTLPMIEANKLYRRLKFGNQWSFWAIPLRYGLHIHGKVDKHGLYNFLRELPSMHTCVEPDHDIIWTKDGWVHTSHPECWMIRVNIFYAEYAELPARGVGE